VSSSELRGRFGALVQKRVLQYSTLLLCTSKQLERVMHNLPDAGLHISRWAGSRRI